MRFPVERQTILKDYQLQTGSLQTFSDVFPIDGSALLKLRLILKCSLTASGASGPIKEGLYKFLKSIYLKTSREVIVPGVPGLGMYIYNLMKDGVQAHDEIAATTGTYYATLDIPFVDNDLKFPEDSMIDTSRINRIELQILTGTIADLLGTVGTSTASFYLTLEVFKTRASVVANVKPEKVPGRLGIAGKPVVYPFFQYLGYVDPSSIKKFDLDSKVGIAYSGFILYNSTSRTEPFYGVGADNIDEISFTDGTNDYLRRVSVGSFKAERRKRVYTEYSGFPLTGIYFHSFISDGSVKGLFPAGGVGRNIRIEIGSVITGTNGTDCLVFGFADLQ